MHRATMADADLVAVALFGPRGYAAELKTAEGRVLARTIGYARLGKTGRILYTEKFRVGDGGSIEDLIRLASAGLIVPARRGMARS